MIWEMLKLPVGWFPFPIYCGQHPGYAKTNSIGGRVSKLEKSFGVLAHDFVWFGLQTKTWQNLPGERIRLIAGWLALGGPTDCATSENSCIVLIRKSRSNGQKCCLPREDVRLHNWVSREWCMYVYQRTYRREQMTCISMSPNTPNNNGNDNLANPRISQGLQFSNNIHSSQWLFWSTTRPTMLANFMLEVECFNRTYSWHSFLLFTDRSINSIRRSFILRIPFLLPVSVLPSSSGRAAVHTKTHIAGWTIKCCDSCI